MKTYQNYINGEWVDSKSGQYTDVINPTSEEVIAQVPTSNAEDVDDAVAAAKAAFPSWNGLAVDERKGYLEKVLEGLKAHKEELVDIVVEEMGASKAFSRDNQVRKSIGELEGSLKALDRFNFEERYDTATVIKEGSGVVACITPWNYPLNQIQRKLTPALLTGNTIVVKPASDTPLTAIKFMEIIEEAGLPKGVVNLITGRGSEAGDLLAGHEDVAIISFTGSTEVGRGLYDKASGSIKRLVLELGGKSALIALKGGDKELAVAKSMNTVLDNQGQTCAALTRLFVPEDELEDYKTAIKAFYDKEVVLGDPVDEATKVGPMVSAKQKETVEDYIKKGKAEGAEVLVGGGKVDRTGYYVDPTVFVNVTNDMTIAQEEIFGPVLCVLTYTDTEDAIKQANDSPYGLSGAVVGPEEEAKAVARQLRTGNVFVNDNPGSDQAPFGGYKMSGLGREKGYYGLEDYVEIKAIFEK